MIWSGLVIVSTHFKHSAFFFLLDNWLINEHSKFFSVKLQKYHMLIFQSNL